MNLDKVVQTFQTTGDHELGKKILEKSYGLADAIIYSKYKQFGFCEDLKSESHDAIISAIYNYDPEKSKSKFLTYCYRCINNRIINFIKTKEKFEDIRVEQIDYYYWQENPLDVIQTLSNMKPRYRDSLISSTGTRCDKHRAKTNFLKQYKQ